MNVKSGFQFGCPRCDKNPKHFKTIKELQTHLEYAHDLTLNDYTSGKLDND